MVVFDPGVLDPRVLLDCFLAMHDPTKVRAHGKHAAGTGQYRSCIFIPSSDGGVVVDNDSDLGTIALRAVGEGRTQLGKELSTQVERMGPKVGDWFWEAEERHQRHNELVRRSSSDASANSNEGLATLSEKDWLVRYGRRTASVLGSSATLEG